MKNILSTLKTKMLLGVILSYLPSPLYAQSEPVPVITRPSAEAQALEKYGEIPTDLYTGRVNIDIPLLNITEYDINVPMKINYFGGGRRRAHRVGLDTLFRRHDITLCLWDAGRNVR